MVMGDINQLGHVIDNLVNNGLAYSSGPPQISIRTSAEGRHAVVRVSDTGVGIGEEMKSAIFEPFRRGEQDGIEDIPGSGLGLYICRELAVAHGGELALEKSVLGQGSTFSLTLPLRATEASMRA